MRLVFRRREDMSVAPAIDPRCPADVFHAQAVNAG